MPQNYDLRLNRERQRQVEQLAQQLNALVIAENRPATSYIQIREALLEASAYMQRVAAMYRVVIEGQERRGGDEG